MMKHLLIAAMLAVIAVPVVAQPLPRPRPVTADADMPRALLGPWCLILANDYVRADKDHCPHKYGDWVRMSITRRSLNDCRVISVEALADPMGEAWLAQVQCPQGPRPMFIGLFLSSGKLFVHEYPNKE